MPILLFFATLDVDAQKYDAFLFLDPIQMQIYEGDTITFSGYLTTADGQYVIPNKPIYIKDDVDFGSDTVLGVVVTDEAGNFAATWTAERRSSGSWDFYASFEGDDQISKARSVTYTVDVIPYSSNSNGAGNSNSGSSKNSYHTQITLDPLPSQVYVNDVVTFTGRLTANEMPAEGALIYIKEDDPLSPDEYLGNGRTDSNGNFVIQWKVKAGQVEKDFDVYAVFEGAQNFPEARSKNQILSVLKYAGSIALDPVPSRASVGSMLMFSGSLRLPTNNPEGSIVYIKDEDTLSRDDLLATGYVDRNGRFSANWIVTDTDPDGIIDIYAVFEGNDAFYRLTTCDSNPTLSFGGGCSDTIKLATYYDDAPVSPSQPNVGYSNKEYIDLYYSLDFTKNPKVVIVPQPDSYNEAVRYAAAVQEGVLMWQSHLGSRTTGNWNVDFEILTKNQIKMSSPDIIVNLVTSEMDAGCSTDYYGYAEIYRKPTKPVNTVVCVSAKGKSHSITQVSTTSAHEFIHAMGLGHAFNKDKDMMCSIEDGKETCKTSGKSKTPSDLNLSGVTSLYGNDGFKNPNSKIVYGTKYALPQAEVKQSAEKSVKTTNSKTTDNKSKQTSEKSSKTIVKTKTNTDTTKKNTASTDKMTVTKQTVKKPVAKTAKSTEKNTFVIDRNDPGWKEYFDLIEKSEAKKKKSK